MGLTIDKLGKINVQDIMDHYNYTDIFYKHYFDKHHPTYCTYYNIDPKKTIIDWREFDALTYEFVGNRSTLRWNKIHLFPMDRVQAISNMQYEQTEENSSTSLETQASFISAYGIKPYYGDVIVFENPVAPEQKVTFVLNGNIANNTFARDTIYTFDLIKYDINLETIQKQVVGEYAYISLLKSIYKIEEALLLNACIASKQEQEKMLKIIADNRNNFVYSI